METDVCAFDEVPDGGKKVVGVGGRKVLLFRSGEEVFAVGHLCPHMKMPLSIGKFDGNEITCRVHGSKWDVRTGDRRKKAWLFGNGGGDCLPTWPVTLKDGRVFVDV